MELVLGLGITGQAVARALTKRGRDVIAFDDRVTDATRAAAADIGVDLAPSLDAAVAVSDVVYPSPGVPDRHPVFATGLPVRSEFDLAREWDDRPLVAITGTDGKTTVVTMVTEMFKASGRTAVAAGNTEVPLVTAIDDPTVEVFVVEASSFRLAHTHRFLPRVATWLNFAPDHLDVHSSLDAYERAKARIWADQRADDIAVGNDDDPVVRRALDEAPARHVSFGTNGDWHAARGELCGPGFSLPVSDLRRALPHDVANALAAAASADGCGADVVAEVLRTFEGLHHRVELVGESGGVRYYDDSKATVPHATLAAVAGFESVVLIAGGRNKGIDLSVLADAAPRIRAVVAIGDSAGDVERAFHGVRPVTVATSMKDAVEQAARIAEPGDAVLLSPACASFDWYTSYAERGDDFVRNVRELVSS